MFKQLKNIWTFKFEVGSKFDNLLWVVVQQVVKWNMGNMNFSRLYINALENQILPKQDLHNQADLDEHEV